MSTRMLRGRSGHHSAAQPVCNLSRLAMLAVSRTGDRCTSWSVRLLRTRKTCICTHPGRSHSWDGLFFVLCRPDFCQVQHWVSRLPRTAHLFPLCVTRDRGPNHLTTDVADERPFFDVACAFQRMMGKRLMTTTTAQGSRCATSIRSRAARGQCGRGRRGRRIGGADAPDRWRSGQVCGARISSAYARPVPGGKTPA